jgi:hypothetical protein
MCEPKFTQTAMLACAMKSSSLSRPEWSVSFVSAGLVRERELKVRIAPEAAVQSSLCSPQMRTCSAASWS